MICVKGFIIYGDLTNEFTVIVNEYLKLKFVLFPYAYVCILKTIAAKGTCKLLINERRNIHPFKKTQVPFFFYCNEFRIE